MSQSLLNKNMAQDVMDICTNACERNVANNEKVRNIVNNRRTRLPPVAPHVTHYPTSAPKRSRRCWTNGMDQAGTLSLGKDLASTSAMRSSHIAQKLYCSHNCSSVLVILTSFVFCSLGLKTSLYVLCWQPRCLCVEMFLE